MRKSTRLIGALAIAGVFAVGGAAFTASNTFSNTSNVAGYGESTETGATITGISYTSSTTDASKLASVAFTSTTNVTGDTATMTLKKGSTLVGSPYSCTLGTWDSTALKMTITCATSDVPAYTTFDTTGLTVTQ